MQYIYIYDFLQQFVYQEISTECPEASEQGLYIANSTTVVKILTYIYTALALQTCLRSWHCWLTLNSSKKKKRERERRRRRQQKKKKQFLNFHCFLLLKDPNRYSAVCCRRHGPLERFGVFFSLSLSADARQHSRFDCTRWQLIGKRDLVYVWP